MWHIRWTYFHSGKHHYESINNCISTISKIIMDPFRSNIVLSQNSKVPPIYIIIIIIIMMHFVPDSDSPVVARTPRHLILCRVKNSDWCIQYALLQNGQINLISQAPRWLHGGVPSLPARAMSVSSPSVNLLGLSESALDVSLGASLSCLAGSWPDDFCTCSVDLSESVRSVSLELHLACSCSSWRMNACNCSQLLTNNYNAVIHLRVCGSCDPRSRWSFGLAVKKLCMILNCILNLLCLNILTWTW